VSESIAIKNVFAKITLVSIIRNFLFLSVRKKEAEKGDAQRSGLAAGLVFEKRQTVTKADKLFEDEGNIKCSTE
jgi:hypothetical protein